jgi:hypothetical protein
MSVALRLIAAAVGASLAISWEVSACTVPPKHLTTHHAELVRRSSRIALGRFEKVASSWLPRFLAGDRYTLQFKTVEVVKGQVGERFSLAFNGAPPEGFKDGKDADFHGHADWDVWEGKLTRQANEANCQMRPRFEVGATYLIFLDEPYHWRSFERVDRPDDRWLAAVKALVADPSRPSGMMQPLASHLTEQHDVFVGQITRCDVAPPETTTYRHEVKVREVLGGGRRESVLLYHGGLQKCEPGAIVLGLIHAVGAYSGPADREPPGRLLPFRDERGNPAKDLTDSIRVDFNAGDSEAIITKDAKPTLAQLRAEMKALPEARRPSH